MPMRRSTVVTTAPVLAVLLVALITVSAIADTDTNVTTLWKDYVVAQKRLQFDVSRLLSDKWPELEGVARLQCDQQFAGIELDNMKFRYLIEHHPDRLVLDQGLDGLAGFEWTEADAETLRATSPGFAKLERWSELNKSRLEEHPKLHVVSDRFFELQRDERYRTTVERYLARMSDLETTLALASRTNKRLMRSDATE